MTQRITKRGEETVLTEPLTYWDNASGAPTSQVKTHRTQSAGYDVTNSYTYDDNGNILTISDGTYTTSYQYDSANQLIREDNQKQNKTTLWVYDAAGNILGEYSNSYTTADVDISQKEPTYLYDEDGFLTEYDGMTIPSDTIGNILKNQDCDYFTYKQGRQLATYKEDGNEWEDTFRYSYNADGILTSVENEYTSYSYTYNGTTLTQLVKTDYSGETTLTFTYGAEGTPSTVTYNGTTYYYTANLQGDVIAILDSTGTAVVTYAYDAWGNSLATTGTMADTLGTANPLRYRGYTYEAESNLYYLQSRFYNPDLRRFISPDKDVATGQGLTGNNMFAYCGNNPISRIDTLGEAWGHWLAAIAVVAVAAVAVVATAGGAAAAVMAVGMVANEIAASSTATTIAAGVFIGSSMALASSTIMAASNSNSAEEFAAYGEAALYSTMGGGVVGGVAANSLPGHSCFIAGTLVKTVQGNIPIEKIQAGDYVWAWDEETGDVALKEVVETYVNETDELVHVFVGGEEIITTPTHPFYSPVKGWTSACKLRAGDILVLVNGEYVVVEKVQHELLESPIKVYNLQVEDYHTYYVSKGGVLVHNKCSDSKSSGSYEIEFESGKNYVGKGDRGRMEVSARAHELMYNDKVVSKTWEYAPDVQTAFVDEYFKMAVRGVNNPNTYNLIWSPGRRIFIYNWIW